jgi:hypothetical protein
MQRCRWAEVQKCRCADEHEVQMCRGAEVRRGAKTHSMCIVIGTEVLRCRCIGPGGEGQGAEGRCIGLGTEGQGAEVQRCRGAEVQKCRGAEVQR